MRCSVKKAEKEKLEKTDISLRKIPNHYSYVAATNPEKVSICRILIPKLYQFISHYITISIKLCNGGNRN